MRVASCSVLLLLGALCCAAAMSTPRDDLVAGGKVKEVTALPGWNASTPLPCQLYSGFVPITAGAEPGQDMQMHYLLYGQEGHNVSDATDDAPIIIWYNGGPGAPSSWGTFIENGPMLTNEQSWTLPMYDPVTGTPALVPNPWAWTKFGTILAFSNPPPTGFSYCSPPGVAGGGDSCGNWTDTRVGVVNAQAIHEVLTNHFPALLANAKRPVYVIGESYAGVYISELIHQIASNTAYSKIGSHIDGVALGDACMGTEQVCGGHRGPKAWLDFFYGHSQLPTDMWQTINAVCTQHELKWGGLSAACKAKVDAAYKAVGSYYVYNLYDTCPDPMFSSGASGNANKRAREMRAKAIMAGERADGPNTPKVPHFNGYWCPGAVFTNYMNMTDVRIALGVSTDSTFFIADDARGMPYDTNLKNAFPFWAALLRNKTITGGASTLTRPFRLMSYNGDADTAVPTTETEPAWYAFAANNSFTKSAEWRQWMTRPAVGGGYVVEWFNGRLSYVTVRGSGHMVPEYKPHAAHTLMQAFVNGRAPPS